MICFFHGRKSMSEGSPRRGGDVRDGMGNCAGRVFFGWERFARFAWIRETRGRSAGEWGDLRGSDQIQSGRAGTWSQPGLIAEVRPNPCAGQARGLAAEIQARIGRGTMSGLFSRLFHVKQGKTVLLATSRFQLPTPHLVLYSIAYLRSPPFSMNRPMPMATESMGDLATIVRMPVTREINRSMPARSAPPPESMMPVS